MAYRHVDAYYADSLYHAVVYLHEVYPKPGRIWINTYNVKWQGWKCLQATVNTPRYTVKGVLLKGSNTNLEGYGKAEVFRENNGLWRVEYSIKITKAAASGESNFNYGLCWQSMLQPVIGVTLTPLNGGYWKAYRQGTATDLYELRGDIYGYSPSHSPSTNDGYGWKPSRVYTTTGTEGTWGTSAWKVNDIIEGVCYATG